MSLPILVEKEKCDYCYFLRDLSERQLSNLHRVSEGEIQIIRNIGRESFTMELCVHHAYPTCLVSHHVTVHITACPTHRMYPNFINDILDGEVTGR